MANIYPERFPSWTAEQPSRSAEQKVKESPRQQILAFMKGETATSFSQAFFEGVNDGLNGLEKVTIDGDVRQQRPPAC